jgi:hypothetical protein
MGLWHGVEYYETEKLVGKEYIKQWPQGLRQSSSWSYDWSYVLAWIGVGWSLVSALLFSGAALCLRNEDYNANGGLSSSNNMHYIMPVYPQKQQGYAYGYAYPTPAYAYQGNQYPPYNY